MAENVKRKKKKRAVLIVLMALVLAVLAVVCVYETELNKAGFKRRRRQQLL